MEETYVVRSCTTYQMSRDSSGGRRRLTHEYYEGVKTSDKETGENGGEVD